MYISHLKLWNFRKFGGEKDISNRQPDLDIKFNKTLNVIIGENDSGKSAIIDAIKLVLKTHSYEFIKIEEDDFFDDITIERFRIEIEFRGLEDNEAKNFTEWLCWDAQSKEPYLRLNLDARRKDGKIYPTDVRAGSDEEGYSLDAEAREYLKVTYLKPLRDAENELISKKNSRLSQVLHAHEEFKRNNSGHTKFVDAHDSFNRHLVDYFENNDGGKNIKNSIDEFIADFFESNYGVKFRTGRSEIKNILEKLEITLMNIDNPGLGTLNRLFMATELLHLKKDNVVKIALIEELEAHLHPQAQMKVIESLQKQKDVQLFLTTHSPNLASKVKLKHLIWCNNRSAFRMGSDNLKKYNPTKLDPEDYEFLEKFLDVTKANLFFAKGVIIVEGWAEEILIPSLAKMINIDLTQKEVSIINVGSKAYKRFAKILLRKEPNEKMNILASIITDSDIKEYEKKDLMKKENYQDCCSKKVSELLKKFKNEFDDEKIEFYIASQWTFEYCMFKSKYLGKFFEKVVKIVYKKPFKNKGWKDVNFEEWLARKLLPGGKLRKTEIAYKMAKIIDRVARRMSKEKKIEFLSIPADDPIRYLVDAIKHVTKVSK